GTDTGSSIRQPAAFCGLTGLKPTYNLVELNGCIPLAPSLDHIGPIGRTALDCAILLDGMVTQSNELVAEPGAFGERSATRTAPGYAAALTGDVADVSIGVD